MLAHVIRLVQTRCMLRLRNQDARNVVYYHFLWARRNLFHSFPVRLLDDPVLVANCHTGIGIDVPTRAERAL